MTMLSIPRDFLKTRSAIQIPPIISYRHGLRSIQPPLIIPPLNSDIQFSTVLPTVTIPEKLKGIRDMKTALPEQFCWGHPDKKDTPEQAKIKKLISPVPDQGRCGSCWEYNLRKYK
jgi:hypothetical protein